MKEHEIYQKYQDVIGYFCIKNGNVIFDFNDKQISVHEMMLINSNLLNEYIKSISMSQQVQPPQQTKQEQRESQQTNQEQQ